MLFRLLLGLAFIFMLCLGGSGIQSDSTFLQGMGVFSLAVSMALMYVLFRTTKLSNFILFSLFSLFLVVMVFGTGGEKIASDNSDTVVEDNVAKEQQKEDAEVDDVATKQVEDIEDKATKIVIAEADDEQEVEEEYYDVSIQENDEDLPQNDEYDILAVEDVEPKQVKEQPADRAQYVEEDDGGLVGKISTFLFGKSKKKEGTVDYNNINPFDYPSITGRPRVVVGSVLVINGLYVKLFGVEAPEPSQTCSDYRDQAYACGRKAITWMQDWIDGREVTCYILNKPVNGNAVGVCMLGQYDLAAVIVNAGWAVAYTRHTKVYVPYENQAKKALRGLWKGEFYMPWDWRQIQNREIKVQYIKRGSGKSMFDEFLEMFK